jgi:hypothetical protein
MPASNLKAVLSRWQTPRKKFYRGIRIFLEAKGPFEVVTAPIISDVY